MVAIAGSKFFWVEPIRQTPNSWRARAAYFMLGHAAMHGRLPSMALTAARIGINMSASRDFYYYLVREELISKPPSNPAAKLFVIRDREGFEAYADEVA